MPSCLAARSIPPQHTRPHQLSCPKYFGAALAQHPRKQLGLLPVHWHFVTAMAGGAPEGPTPITLMCLGVSLWERPQRPRVPPSTATAAQLQRYFPSCGQGNELLLSPARHHPWAGMPSVWAHGRSFLPSGTEECCIYWNMEEKCRQQRCHYSKQNLVTDCTLISP